MLNFETEIVGNYTHIQANSWLLFNNVYVYNNNTYTFFLRKIKKDIEKILLQFSKNIIIEIKTRNGFSEKCFCDINLILKNKDENLVNNIKNLINNSFLGYKECGIQAKR